MKKKIEISTLFLVVLLSVSLCSSASSHEGEEVEDERDFSYIVGSPTGPERWGYLREEWATCKDGNRQSPIDLPLLQSQVVPTSQQVFFFYNPANATIKNRGHDIEVRWAEGVSKIRINNSDYILQQCHWHTPSEHTIVGRRYAMELHLVHENPDPNALHKFAVVAVLYDIGPRDPFLGQLEDEIRQISDTSLEVPAGVVNPAEPIMGRGTRYYRYNGSFTTPPCTEGVIWTVDTTIGTVSKDQIKLLRQAVDDDAMQNARPIQPRNGRNINLYRVP